MNVPDGDKFEILAGFLGPLMDLLGAHATDQDVTADDVIDFFALGIAAVIENDSHLTTPQLRRLAVEAAAKRITGRLKAIAEFRNIHGVGFLASALDAQPDDGTFN